MSVRRPGLARRRLTAGFVAAATVVALAGGCSGEEPSGGAERQATADPQGVASGGSRLPVRVGVGQVTGRLKPVVARITAVRVGRVVDAWFEAAYLRGPWPRSRFVEAFPGFTEGTVRDARRDRRLMSNVAIAGDIEAVTPRAKLVRVDVLAAGRRPVGATARFRLVFATDGTYRRQVAVAGRLFLSQGPAQRWRVFGYQVRRASLVPSSRPSGDSSGSGSAAEEAS